MTFLFLFSSTETHEDEIGFLFEWTYFFGFITISIRMSIAVARMIHFVVVVRTDSKKFRRWGTGKIIGEQTLEQRNEIFVFLDSDCRCVPSLIARKEREKKRSQYFSQTQRIDGLVDARNVSLTNDARTNSERVRTDKGETANSSLQRLKGPCPNVCSQNIRFFFALS